MQYIKHDKSLSYYIHIDIGGAERVDINIAKSKNPEFEYHVVEVVRSFLHY